MNWIPLTALSFGAERKTDSNLSYGKSRVAGNIEMTYIMHCRAGCMPGQKDVFTKNSLTKPSLNTALENNTFTNAFKRKCLKGENQPIGTRFISTSQNDFTFDRFAPIDDETLNISIQAAYQQVYGNLHAMESERPIELERRLRNGDISIKEFVRGLAKSCFYLKHYFESVNQQRSVELNFKHLLGRPPLNQIEIINNIKLIWEEGIEFQIDTLIDSCEYEMAFGEDTVPYQRCWESPCGYRTSSFNNTAKLTKGFATSDNAIHQRTTSEDALGGKSLLLNELANEINKEIEIPSHFLFLISQSKKNVPISSTT